MSYLLVKWIHILSATVLVGVGFGTAFYKWMSDRSRDVSTIANVSHFVVVADWVFTTPAIILQLATGLWLATHAGYPLSTGWVAYALVLYLLAGSCWLPVLFLQYRMRSLAHDARAKGEGLGPEYFRYARFWFWLGVIAFSAMVVVYWLMVTKPALYGSQ